ncbi:phosphoethanolamine/phosphocholine phosphatase 1 [Hibiscus trionum]|uniref:Phosphoethanolamine/phosphocholine phosphatase 1 n=1 Tax=Hibiscus trionum TaxID=183268 RepID=A0A9W7M8X3_HIBTR|nr:phosphoethanolamine/phosphocholine phosphatase 1 [Hibiscus trionum]
MAGAGIVVVFDFDKTIIDCDSDNWVVDELGATELFEQLLPTMPWNSLMVRMMEELHSQGTRIEDIVAVLKRTPIHPRIIEAIKSAYALGCDLKIVSDANTFFIEKILEHRGLKECFSEIHTNPSFVDEEGRLRIFPHHDFTKSSHGCVHPSCPPNMCKGTVIQKIQASLSMEDHKKTIIYLGDGLGDFCPSLKLGDGDYVMPRKGFPVWDLICKNRNLIKAGICEWSNGDGFEQVLLHLITRISIYGNNTGADTGPLYSVDCKIETMPLSAATNAEAFSKALPVFH